MCQTALSRHLKFLTSGHSDAQLCASECPDVKN